MTVKLTTTQSTKEKVRNTLGLLSREARNETMFTKPWDRLQTRFRALCLGYFDRVLSFGPLQLPLPTKTTLCCCCCYCSSKIQLTCTSHHHVASPSLLSAVVSPSVNKGKHAVGNPPPGAQMGLAYMRKFQFRSVQLTTRLRTDGLQSRFPLSTRPGFTRQGESRTVRLF